MEDGIVHSLLKDKVLKNLEARVQFPPPQYQQKFPMDYHGNFCLYFFKAGIARFINIYSCDTLDLLHKDFPTAISRFRPVGDSTESATTSEKIIQRILCIRFIIFPASRSKSENLVTEIFMQ